MIVQYILIKYMEVYARLITDEKTIYFKMNQNGFMKYYI